MASFMFVGTPHATSQDRVQGDGKKSKIEHSTAMVTLEIEKALMYKMSSQGIPEYIIKITDS